MRAAIRNCTIALIVSTLPASAEKLTLVALGDSLTQGFGLPQQDGFVPQLQGSGSNRCHRVRESRHDIQTAHFLGHAKTKNDVSQLFGGRRRTAD